MMDATLLLILLIVGIGMSMLVLFQLSSLKLKSRVSTVEQTREVASISLSQAVVGIRDDLTTARTGLLQVQTYAFARQDLERRTSESIRRLELVIAGTYSKGVGGENLLDAVFAQLPAEWQVRDFRVAGKPVEFGVRLPNNLILPIDSKWPATGLLEQFASSEDGARHQLKIQIQQEVMSRAKEVQKYIDPSRTTSFAIVAVPESVYELSHGAQVEMLKLNVVLVAYSMLLPYLLLVFNTVNQASRDVDLEKLGTYMRATEVAVRALQDELDGRFARALTMLTNSRNDSSVLVGRLHVGLANMMISAGAQPVQAELSPVISADALAAVPAAARGELPAAF